MPRFSQVGLRASQRSGVEESLAFASSQDSAGADHALSVPTKAARPVLSVGVIIDLFQSASAGGHVKTWEKLARAACGEPLDLTVYFFGSEKKVLPLAENVRYVHLPPVWSTASLPFLEGIPAHTDLAPLHAAAFRRFRSHHVLHATDAYFSLARAARLVSRWSRRALVHSTHTDTPGYTRVYTEQVLRRLCGDGMLGRTLRERWKVPERMGRRMERRLQRYIGSCDWALAPDESARRQLQSAIGAGRTSLLRRGVDAELFHPSHRDRARLEKQYGLSPDHLVLLFAGRIDSGKDMPTLARTTRLLLDRGLPVHLICAGEGSYTQSVRDLLGPSVSFPGQVPQEELAWLYASADLFVFCSQIEIFPNVILEAKSSGLPVVASAHGGSGMLVGATSAEAGGVAVAGNDPEEWARQIEILLRQPERLQAMRRAARRAVESQWPSWRQVLREDLIPVWHRVARDRGLLA